MVCNPENNAPTFAYQPTTEIDDTLNYATDKVSLEFSHEVNETVTELQSEIAKLRLELDNARAELEKARTDSLVDTLTGCYNQNYFEKFKNENFSPNRSNNKIGLVFIDINDLKAVNDTEGHEAGNQLIKSVADFLKSNFRADDIVVRVGGDEFIIICGNDQADELFNEKLNLRAAAIFSDTQNRLAYGVATYDDQQDSNLRDTVRRADALMYESKIKTKGFAR